jgi:hypothetical protein
MRNQSQQAMLDGFFASVCGTEYPQRGVSDRAFAKARDRLHMPAFASLNDPSFAAPMKQAWSNAGAACAWSPPMRRC